MEIEIEDVTRFEVVGRLQREVERLRGEENTLMEERERRGDRIVGLRAVRSLPHPSAEPHTVPPRWPVRERISSGCLIERSCVLTDHYFG